MADLAISQADTRDGDTSFSASSDRAGGGIGGEGAILAGVAPDCALGAMSGSDAASLAGSGLRCCECDLILCESLEGTGEGGRDGLNFNRSLSTLLLIYFRMVRVENGTSWIVEESGKELKQDHYDVPCSTRGGL